ncbi:MAG: FtsX-like permease family protein [Myxococcota bacterium]|nr:FtsX-like permease family protein [Myxococcota bacterium]
MIPVRYNVRSLAVRKATTIATAGGIALVVFVLASSLMLSAGIKKTLGSSGKPDNAIVLRMGSDAELGSVVEESSVALILAAPGVKTDDRGQPLGTAEIVTVAAMPKIGVDGVTNVSFRGVADDVTRFRPDVRIVAGRPARPGSDEAVIGARIRGRIKGLELDQSFDIKKNRPVKVVGVFEAEGSAYESEVWVDRELLRDAYHREGIVSSVRVRLDSPTKFDAFRSSIENDKRLGLQALRESAFYERQSEGAATFVSALGTIVSVFFALGAMIGATITMYAAVANRQREIGTLRALGFSRASILVSFLLEAVVLAGAGGAIGAAASLAMGLVHFSMINFASWSEIVFSFDPTPPILLTAVLFACGMGVLGGFFPAVRAARTSPLRAIRA